jgi:hypothetical protein
METLKTIEQLNGSAKNLIDSTNSLLTEFNYLRLSVWDKNVDNILNSTTLMHVKLSTVLINLTVVLKHARVLLPKSKANEDVCAVWVKQINDSNSVLLKLSNELTNFSYFIKGLNA